MRAAGSATLLAAIVLTLAAAPVRAGLFDDDEARAGLARLRDDVAQQGRKMETGFDLATRSQIELSNQIEALKAELAKLRGQIEVHSYETEAAKKRQTDFYADLDARLRKLETAAQVQAEAKTAVPAVDPAAETRDYEAALTLFKTAKYKDALAAFQDFIKSYGASALAASAHYWAATCHYQLREYARAAEMFAMVSAGWPNDIKAPDALLGQANSQQLNGDAKAARKTFESLIEKFPNSSAAQTARLRLKQK